MASRIAESHPARAWPVVQRRNTKGINLLFATSITRPSRNLMHPHRIYPRLYGDVHAISVDLLFLCRFRLDQDCKEI